jgi:hypothetical protein
MYMDATERLGELLRQTYEMAVAPEPWTMPGLVSASSGASGQAGDHHHRAWANLVLAGRATSVPFMAVLTGPVRITTDNITMAATCTDHCFPW